MNSIPLYRSAVARFVVLIAMSVLAISSGCASKPDAKDTVDSMSTFGAETVKSKDSIDQAVKALETLTSSQAADIKPNLDAYSMAVTQLDEQAKLVKANAEKMKSNGDSFFKDWEGSEDVSPARRAELTDAYGQIKANMASAKDAFVPFLASLKDIQSYVSLDPTVKGITSMDALVSTAKSNSVEVKSRLDAVLTQVNSVRGMLSTK